MHQREPELSPQQLREIAERNRGEFRAIQSIQDSTPPWDYLLKDREIGPALRIDRNADGSIRGAELIDRSPDKRLLKRLWAITEEHRRKEYERGQNLQHEPEALERSGAAAERRMMKTYSSGTSTRWFLPT